MGNYIDMNDAYMQAPRDQVRTMSMAEYLAMLKRRWWLCILVPLLAVAAAYGASLLQEPLYTASATLFVNQAASSELGDTLDVYGASALTQTYSNLVLSRPVLERVIAKLSLSDTVSELASRMSAGAKPNTQIINISVEYPDPRLAADIANATGEEFVTWLADFQTVASRPSTSALQESIDRARADMDKALADLAALRSKPGTRTADEESQITNLERLIEQHQKTYGGLLELQQRLELAQLASQNRVSLVAPAEPPQGPSGLPSVVNLALALMLGSGLAGMGVVLLERTNERVRLPHHVEREIGLPVLTSLPRSRQHGRVEILVTPQSEYSDAIRLLRTRLYFATNGSGLGALVITSSEPNEGKSSTAANLSAALAQAGQRVVLIDANFRHPHQHEFWGGDPNQPGLISLLSRPVLQLEHLLVDGPIPGLQLLYAGSRSDGPVELMSNDHLKEVIARLKPLADVIVIDAPSLATSDALLVAAAGDHAIIVVGAGQTRPDSLRAALASIRATGVKVLGVVLNGVGPRDSSS